MQFKLDDTIFEDEIIQDYESEDPCEIFPFKNEQNPEDDLTIHNHLNQLDFNQNLFLESKDEKKDFTLFNDKDDIKDDNETFNSIKKHFPFTYSLEPISEEQEEENKIKEDQLRFGLEPNQNPALQSFQLSELNEELKLFDESLEKKFSSKYETKPIFKHNRLNTKRRRKIMGDNMRKRIKSDFCKGIKQKLNYILKDKNIDQFLDFPQTIVTDVTKERNKNNLGMTLEEVLSGGDYNSRIINKKRKKKESDSKIPLWFLVRRYIEIKETEKIMKNNKEILNILNQSQNESINILLKKNMEIIYEEYLNSKRFEKSIEGLKEKGNYYSYIYDYIEIAKKFVVFCNNENDANEDEED